MSQPLITLVVPTYNRAHLLPATLQSLQGQANRDFEIIIVDDGSTDNTEEAVQPFLNDYTRYIRKENAERAAARNFGARLGTGLYVNFFDSDDLALPNHTSEAAALIGKYNNPEWFQLAFEWVNSRGQVFKRYNNRKGETLNKSLSTGNHLGCNGVFVRRDIFLSNPFNEDRALTASEDFECWLRLAARYPLYYSNTITSQLVDHPQRSVRTISVEPLIRRIHTLLHCVEADPFIRKYYGRSIRKIRADSYSYISLHTASYRKGKLVAVRYLLRALSQSGYLLRTRRLYVIFRDLLLGWAN